MKIKETVALIVKNLPKGSCYALGISTGLFVSLGINKLVDIYYDKKYPDTNLNSGVCYLEGFYDGTKVNNTIIETQSKQIQKLENEISIMKGKERVLKEITES